MRTHRVRTDVDRSGPPGYLTEANLAMTSTTPIILLDLPITGMDCQDEVRHIEHAVGDLDGVEEVHALLASNRTTIRFDPDRVTREQIQAAIESTGCGIRPADMVTVDLAVMGMDCQDEVSHIEAAVSALSGVQTVQALLASNRATVTFDPSLVSLDQLRAAIASTGCAVVESAAPDGPGVTTPVQPRRDVAQVIGWAALGLVAAVVVVAALGERLGLFDAVLEQLPWWIPALAILLGGWKVFRGVARAARRFEVTGHTLMTVGVVASAAIGQWTTAALIVFFMRFADWLEELTTERSRAAIQARVGLQPAIARVIRAGAEVEIPVDGEVIDGSAPVDQAAITGESVPMDKAAGDPVFAATVAQAGFLKVRATAVGRDTTFARIVRLVEEAEAHRAPVQRFADRFAGYYLPTVLVIGLGTYLVTRNLVSAVAVIVVACACAITMATPVVVLASVGNAARRGLLVKGGAAIEQLARVDAVVVDKTGTLTFGRPVVTDIVPLDSSDPAELLRLVATLEGRSEHPLGRAIVDAAGERGLRLPEPESFSPVPGQGVVGLVDGRELAVGNRRLLADRGIAPEPAVEARAVALEGAGRTVFFVAGGQAVLGLIALADTVRPEARAALDQLRRLGIKELILLTGDNTAVARAVAGELGIDFRAELLPEDKIAAVRELQAKGRVVMMVGDGVNDAPALAQADVGVAMGMAGTAVAIEAADVALLRDDWMLVPAAIRLGRRGAGTIRQNLGFAAIYNVVGISLAAAGILPPVWAAAAQSLPDVAIMLNSARLIRARIN